MKKITLNTDTFIFLFFIADHIKQTTFWKTKKHAQSLYLTFTRCLKKDFICLCGKIFQIYKRIFLVDRN